MKLRVRLDNIELEYEDPEEIQDALSYLGFDDDSGFLDRASKPNPIANPKPLRTPPEPTNRVSAREFERKSWHDGLDETPDGLPIRSGLEPGGSCRVREGVVQSSSKDEGPRCQECSGPIHPLDEEAAIELYGIVACTSCGKDLQ